KVALMKSPPLLALVAALFVGAPVFGDPPDPHQGIKHMLTGWQALPYATGVYLAKAELGSNGLAKLTIEGGGWQGAGGGPGGGAGVCGGECVAEYAERDV